MIDRHFVKNEYECNPVSEQAFDAGNALEKANFCQATVYEFAAKKGNSCLYHKLFLSMFCNICYA